MIQARWLAVALLGTVAIAVADNNSIFNPAYPAFSTFTPCSTAGIVDAEEYYNALAEGLAGAKKSIFVTGWKIHPDVVLTARRPGESGQVTFIDLIRAAVKRGVKVHVLMWTSAWEKAQRIVTNDFMAYRLTEGAKMMEEAGAVVLIDEGHMAGITDWANMRWSQHQKVVIVDYQMVFEGGIDVCVARWDSNKHLFHEPGRVDHDYADWSKQAEHMPWHDVALAANGDIGRQIFNNFVERWTDYCGSIWFFKPSACKDGNVPAFLGDTMQPELWHGAPVDSECQAQRTAGGWSYGMKDNEESVLAAWIEGIRQSQHYIYIEQQYFCSAPKAQNGIADAIFDKLDRSLRAKTPFKVVVVVPFALEEKQMVYPTMQTIGLYKDSLVPRLNRLIETLTPSDPEYYGNLDLEDWLLFTTLGVFDSDDATKTARFRALFVHSKLMIVDDRVINVGSANGNDRSFYGDRDSELNVVVRAMEDKLVPSKMGGADFSVGRAAHDLRVRLWAEHMGIAADDAEAIDAIRDPISGFALYRQRARDNLAVARDVFGIDPPQMNVQEDHDKLFDPEAYAKAGLDDASFARVASLKNANSHLLHYPYDTWGTDADSMESFLNKVPFFKELFLMRRPAPGSMRRAGKTDPAAAKIRGSAAESWTLPVVAIGSVAIIAVVILGVAARYNAARRAAAGIPGAGWQALSP